MHKMVEATAPGKVILFGEHAVVYGRPAIAAPVTRLRASAVIESSGDADVLLIAPDLGVRGRLSEAEPGDPLAATLHLSQSRLAIPKLGGFSLTVTSDIPIAGGLGSGAAISVAVIRAFLAYYDLAATTGRDQISALAYEVERLHHGTPSGIDNTVVAYEQMVYFKRQEPLDRIEVFSPPRPLRLAVGDTGLRSATRDVVGDVRSQWLGDRTRFEQIFDACGQIAEAGRGAIAAGDLAAVGRLMNENHEWLVEMTVSNPRLDQLVEAARRAGALGAKLSGAGRGGNMIALIEAETQATVTEALLAAGAVRVWVSDVG